MSIVLKLVIVWAVLLTAFLWDFHKRNINFEVRK